MRSDMDKVLVERPRHGGHGARKGRPARDPEALPGFLGLRRQVKERGDFKGLNENLAPLRRYLERQVGRPWNKVYSEICARIDKGNTVQAHVLTHIDQFLHLRVEKAAPSPAAPCGVVALQRWIGRRAIRPGELYVDPDDGIVKRARRKVTAPARAGAPIARKDMAPGVMAVEAQGVWYAVQIIPFDLIAEPGQGGNPSFRTPQEVSLTWPDPVLGLVTAARSNDIQRLAQVYGPGRLGVAKRQLSGRELRLHGLENAGRE